jgi:hypothetical protein
MKDNKEVSIGKFYTFYGKKYKCIAFRSSEEKAEALKIRLEKVGTIKVHIVKHSYKVVGLPNNYSIWARPNKSLVWDKFDSTIEQLF